MSKFRKKPIVIEAVQFTNMDKDGNAGLWGFSEEELTRFCPDISWTECGSPLIKTLEGDMVMNNYDWLIKGVKGEFYPCKPDIFEKTYEAVEESQ